MLTPSGQQIELRHEDQRAVVVEVGGGLRSYELDGLDVLDGYREDEMCSDARGQALIPWPNRLRDGRYEFAGETHQLPLSEPETQNAIHGLIRWANWTVAEHSDAAAAMEHLLYPQPGYPFALVLRVEYALSGDGLTVSTAATNVGETACPYAAGAHPYLTAGTDTIDSCDLRAPGRSWMPTDERCIPTGSEPVDGTEFDFRSPRQIGSTKLNTAFGDLERDRDSRARVELRAPDGRHLALWLDEGYPYLMLFTGDPLGEVARRRRGLGVEPMTCAPNAFQTGEGLLTLQPGETFTSGWGIDPRAGASDRSR
jgi:aldose 1-epimerase